MSRFPYHIFRAYDIRGVYGDDLTDDVAHAVGWAFGEMLKSRTGNKSPVVTVGMDARLHSPSIKGSFQRGLVKTGCRITDIGLCPTPLVYYSAFRLHPDGFAMVTASHNPPGDNGFKLGIGLQTLSSEDITALGRAAVGAPANIPLEGEVASDKMDIISLYQKELSDNFAEMRALLKGLNRPIKIVIDSGNGTAGIVLPDIMKGLGIDVVEMYSEPDGRFPNHHPDPTLPEAVEDIKATVLETKADFGVALDGDADRIGIVDEAGSVIWGDMLLLILARDIIENWKRRGGEEEPPLVISEVKASQVLYDGVEKAGGRAMMWKTGHSLIKARMKETGAALAGEMSGHLFFADRFYGFDDALYAAVRLVEVYAGAMADGRIHKFSDLLSDVPAIYNTPEIRVTCPDEDKFRVVEEVIRLLTEHRDAGDDPVIREVVDVDGARVIFPDGWGLLRASNTQPVLVMRYEAVDENILHEYRAFLDGMVQSVLELKGIRDK